VYVIGGAGIKKDIPIRKCRFNLIARRHCARFGEFRETGTSSPQGKAEEEP
jgi:hypothetical protein